MLDLSPSYCSKISTEHRREFGQYFTPSDVAIFMCRWVLLGGIQHFHDPAFGLGSFYFAASSLDSSIAFSGSEVDSEILSHFQDANPKPNSLSLCCADYLTTWDQKHDGIVCNPPYKRFQKFENRKDVSDYFERRLQTRLSGYTNIASAFLLKSLSELNSNGRLAYLMPLEFLNTGYGELIKEKLISQGALKVLIRFDKGRERDIFPDATTSIGIILACKDGQQDPVRFYTVHQLSELQGILSTQPENAVPGRELAPSEKWLRFFDSTSSVPSATNLISIDSYGSFSRGIATGANEFFAMTRTQSERVKIPRSSFLNCITKSAQIKGAIFTNADFDALERLDANVLLLNADNRSGEATREYIQFGESRGYHERYLTKMRTPWYKLERRKPAPLLFGVFSRGKFKVVRNLSAAVNLTCYHGFYPNLFGQQFCDALFLYFQSRAARSLLTHSMRHYGDGLEKFEPNDLNSAPAPSPDWFSQLPEGFVRKEMENCLNQNSISGEMEAIFDSLLSPDSPNTDTS